MTARAKKPVSLAAEIRSLRAYVMKATAVVAACEARCAVIDERVVALHRKLSEAIVELREHAHRRAASGYETVAEQRLGVSVSDASFPLGDPRRYGAIANVPVLHPSEIQSDPQPRWPTSSASERDICQRCGRDVGPGGLLNVHDCPGSPTIPVLQRSEVQTGFDHDP